jgi:hypothetical protein
MAHLYMDDGTIDSEDYASNYMYFDGNNPECLRRMQALARRLAASPPEKKNAILDRIRSRPDLSGSPA